MELGCAGPPSDVQPACPPAPGLSSSNRSGTPASRPPLTSSSARAPSASSSATSPRSFVAKVFNNCTLRRTGRPLALTNRAAGHNLGRGRNRSADCNPSPRSKSMHCPLTEVTTPTPYLHLETPLDPPRQHTLTRRQCGQTTPPPQDASDIISTNATTRRSTPNPSLAPTTVLAITLDTPSAPSSISQNRDPGRASCHSVMRMSGAPRSRKSANAAHRLTSPSMQISAGDSCTSLRPPRRCRPCEKYY